MQPIEQKLGGGLDLKKEGVVTGPASTARQLKELATIQRDAFLPFYAKWGSGDRAKLTAGELEVSFQRDAAVCHLSSKHNRSAPGYHLSEAGADTPIAKRELSDRSTAIVALGQRGEVIGGALLFPVKSPDNAVELFRVAVESSNRGKGVARAISCAAVEWAAAARYSQVFFETIEPAMAANASALGFSEVMNPGTDPKWGAFYRKRSSAYGMTTQLRLFVLDLDTGPSSIYGKVQEFFSESMRQYRKLLGR
jgi:GNAT superfamily N-acetyltransferase